MSTSKQGRIRYLEEKLFGENEEYDVDSAVSLRRNRLVSTLLSSVTLWLARIFTVLTLFIAAKSFELEWFSVSITDYSGKVKEISVDKL